MRKMHATGFTIIHNDLKGKWATEEQISMPTGTKSQINQKRTSCIITACYVLYNMAKDLGVVIWLKKKVYVKSITKWINKKLKSNTLALDIFY